MDSSLSMLSFQGVSHWYGAHQALNSLNLDIPRGEIFGLLGPNGAGKTTTVKIATALLQPAQGKVLLKGESVQENPLRAKHLYGLLRDEPFFYEQLSARQFLLFIGNIRKLSSAELEKKIDSLLLFFGLQEVSKASILTYSLGMKKKLGLAAAILHDPEILFLDEPTSGLDPLSSRNTRDLLKKLKEKGITIFLTTHILEMAEELCDRVGILEKGKLIALGTIEKLRSDQQEKLEDVFLRMTRGEGEEKKE